MSTVIVVFVGLALGAALVSAFFSAATYLRLVKESLDRADRAPKEVVSPEAARLRQEWANLEGSIMEVPPREAPGEQTDIFAAVPSVAGPPFPPPMVGDQTLYQHLLHTWYSDGVCTRIVDNFYARAASSYRVRPLFEGKDLNAIKKKFLATFLILADKGVDERAARTLIAKHAHLKMSVGAYDDTMLALENTLWDYNVPEATIKQMVPMVDYFRVHMAVES